MRSASARLLVIAAVYLTPFAPWSAGGFIWAQDIGGPQEGPPRSPRGPGRGPLDRPMHTLPPGRWWNDPQFAEQLGLTGDQGKKLDAVFNQNKLKLIDLSSTLQKEEVILEPLLAAEKPDETRILAQISRVAEARAELEKGNGRMLLGFRAILTQDQWRRLQAGPPDRHGPPPHF